MKVTHHFETGHHTELLQSRQSKVDTPTKKAGAHHQADLNTDTARARARSQLKTEGGNFGLNQTQANTSSYEHYPNTSQKLDSKSQTLTQYNPRAAKMKTCSEHFRSLQAIEDMKNNPTGRIMNQEALLALIKRQKFQIENYKQKIDRLSKDVDRYKAEINLLKEQN